MYVEDIYEYILKQRVLDKWDNNKIDSNLLKIKIFIIEYRNRCMEKKLTI